MSKQTINIGASPNDGTGTPLRTSFDYTNQNFTELYNALGGGVGLPGSTNQIIFNNGSSLAGNANLLWNSTLNLLTVTGSANITADLTVDGGTLKVDSTNNFVGINKTPTVALDVSGSATITGALTVQGSGPHQFGTSNYSQFDQSSLRFVGSRATPGALSIYSNGSRLIFQCDTNGYLFQNGANTVTLLSIANDATQLTVNSTGFGVGVTPSLEKLQVNGGIVLSPPATPATLATNGQLTVNATSNTNLRFSYRGSDGTTRVANLTLA